MKFFSLNKRIYWRVTSAIAVLVFIMSGAVWAQTNLGSNPNFNFNSPGAKVIIVGPPDILTMEGSQTSNFTQVCTFEEAINIVLDVTGKNKIEFKESVIDMCDNETIQNINQYIQLENTGEVTVRSDKLPYLKDKSAEITMRNLPFVNEPMVEVDGRPATQADIENKSWDSDSGTLTFTAKHFTTYRAVDAYKSLPYDGLIVERAPLIDKPPLTDYLIVFGAGSLMILAMIVAIVLLWKKQRKYLLAFAIVILAVVLAYLFMLNIKSRLITTDIDPHGITSLPTPPASFLENWQTYRNEEFGFEVKYPADWKSWTTSRDDGSLPYIDFPSTALIRFDRVWHYNDPDPWGYYWIDILVEPNPGEEPLTKEWYKKTWAPAHGISIPNSPHTFFSRSEETYFQGLRALVDTNEILFEKDGFIFEMRGLQTGVIAEHEFQTSVQVFDQILSTFRFVE